MTDIAIRVENLAKRYRIGKALATSEDNGSFLHKVSNQLQYLQGTIRRPSPDELIWALDGVSFQVERGNVLGVIGRNGAGKSTLLKILSRVTEPTHGRAVINGRVGALLEVGTGFHSELTGRENIFLSGAILGMKRLEINKKFEEIVDFSGIHQFLDTPIKYYSSGMRVRLGFAVAAHLEPEVLLIDEVLAVGDAEFQKKCLGKMSEVAKEGRTVLFVSHNMAAVQSLCTHGIVLQKGKVLVDGSIGEAVSAYLKMIEEMSHKGLANRSDREGEGKIRLIGVDITDVENQSSMTLMMGKPAKFTFYLSEIPQNFNFEYLDFAIYDTQGRSIAYFNSIDRGERDIEVSDSGPKVECILDELLLLPGRYRINVGIKGNGDIQDHIEAAAYFNVEEGRVRGTPVLARAQRLGNVFFPHRWVLPPGR